MGKLRKGDIGQFGFTVYHFDMPADEPRARVIKRTLERATAKAAPVFLNQPGYRRHEAARYTAVLLAKLEEPIKQYKMGAAPPSEIDRAAAATRIKGKTKKERERILQIEWIARKEKEDAAERIEAAMAYFNISDDLPLEVQWELLALSLLGAHFKGCRSLAEAPGGAPSVSPSAYAELAADFDRFKKASLSFHKNTDVARSYLQHKGGKVRVGHETIASIGGLVKAVRRGRSL